MSVVMRWVFLSVTLRPQSSAGTITWSKGTQMLQPDCLVQTLALPLTGVSPWASHSLCSNFLLWGEEEEVLRIEPRSVPPLAKPPSNGSSFSYDPLESSPH